MLFSNFDVPGGIFASSFHLSHNHVTSAGKKENFRIRIWRWPHIVDKKEKASDLFLESLLAQSFGFEVWGDLEESLFA